MDENRIPDVLNRTACARHGWRDQGARHGQPCWWIWTLAGTKTPAVCNRRALKAGFVGEIDPRSLRKR